MTSSLGNSRSDPLNYGEKGFRGRSQPAPWYLSTFRACGTLDGLKDLHIAGEEIYLSLHPRHRDITPDPLGLGHSASHPHELRITTDDPNWGTLDNPLIKGSLGGLHTVEVLDVQCQGGQLVPAKIRGCFVKEKLG